METFQDSCDITRIFTATDHCGDEGNSQEVFFQMKLPSSSPAEIYFSEAEDGEFYLQTYSYFGVLDESCFEVNAEISVDGAPAESISNGTFLDTPGSYVLTVNAEDCEGTAVSEQANFDLLEKPYADAGGPYQGEQGVVITLDGGESFCPPELGGITEYAWDFDLTDDGDGGYRHLGEVVDFVKSDGDPYDDGDYNVGLRITTLSGEVKYDNAQVTINDALPRCDPGGPYEVEQGRFLTFDGSASTPGTSSEPILAYLWDFGEYEGDLDQQFALNITQPEYFYSDEGEYTVTLTVYDIDSECSAETTVTVIDVSPEVRDLSVVGPSPYYEGTSLTFSSGTTTAGSGAEPIILFSWDWGDGSVTQSNPGESLRRPTHVFQDSGDFNICLTVNDEDSDDTGCLVVTIEDLKPVARFDGDVFAIEGREAFFSIAGTRSGGDADPLTYAIVDWGDGTSTRIDDFSQTDISHVFETDGTLMIQFSVFDEEENDPTSVYLEVYVDDVSPRAEISQLSITIEEGLASTWSAANSEPGAPTDPISGYTWDWGDGDTSVGEEASHVYADDGTYLLRLTAEDSDGSLSTTSRFITVINRAPFDGVILADSTRLDYGEPARFEVEFSDVPNDTVAIFWRMGSGGATYSNRRVVNHVYREIGVFTIRVILTDDDGGETELTLDVEVTPAGPRILLPEIDDVAEGEELNFDVELRAAEISQGGIDGPVELRVLRAPTGMSWTQAESANPQLSNRFAFSWTTSAEDAGDHLIRILGVSPSGIERITERIIRVTEAKELQLASLGGTTERALFSLFSYPSDTRTRQARLERIASIDVGRGVGHLLHERDQYFVSVPMSGKVAVINALNGELQRLIPVGDEPYALASSANYIWGFDGRSPTVFAVDRRLKIYRRSSIDALQGYIIAAQGIESVLGDRIAVISSLGELLILNPEAFVSNQPSRAITHRFDLAKLTNTALSSSLSLTSVGGGILQTPDLLIAYTSRSAVAFELNAINESPLSPLWSLKSAASIRTLAAHQGYLWSTSSQGLRRFEWPISGQGLGVDAPSVEGMILDLNQLSTIEAVPGPLMGEATIVTATARQLNHISSDSLRPLITTAGVNIQRLLVTERNTRE
jgi:PKD repeat protein